MTFWLRLNRAVFRQLITAVVVIPFLMPLHAVYSQSTDWWSFQPLVNVPLPKLESRDEKHARHPIDLFVIDKLNRHRLSLSPEADRRTLLRRVTFDLVGLPPTPQEYQAFLDDPDPMAYERVVDRLLQSPRHGERWAQHWLDVVHYADSHGQDQDRPRTNAWPFRDYVIRSLNADKPYAEFVSEQIAGDALAPTNGNSIVATGFLAAGPWDESGLMGIREDSLDRQIARYLDRDDIVSSTMSTFNGITAGCARCHDHKFDPITQEDYYALQAVFAGIDKAERDFDSDPAIAWQREDLVRLLRSIREAATPQPELVQAMEHAISALPHPSKVYCGTNRFNANGSFKPATKPREVHVLEQGDVQRPIKPATPGSVIAVPGQSARFIVTNVDDESQRRIALAQWLASGDNPLTWRTIVNRVWHYHFGKGIVDTPNDLGAMGGTPSHSELLDWLAVEFRNEGGHLKSLHRWIVCSATYRQQNGLRKEPNSFDADNRLLWRRSAVRLDAESFRDAVLFLSGQLDECMYGPPVMQFVMKPGVHVTPIADYDQFDLNDSKAKRRSIYRYMFRTSPDPLLEALDCPDSSQSAPVRTQSLGAIQALSLWNNKFSLHFANRFAEKIASHHTDVELQLIAISQNLFLRIPSEDELRTWRDYAKQHGMSNLCRVLLNTNEFLFVD